MSYEYLDSEREFREMEFDRVAELYHMEFYELVKEPKHDTERDGINDQSPIS